MRLLHLSDFVIAVYLLLTGNCRGQSLRIRRRLVKVESPWRLSGIFDSDNQVQNNKNNSNHGIKLLLEMDMFERLLEGSLSLSMPDYPTTSPPSGSVPTPEPVAPSTLTPISTPAPTVIKTLSPSFQVSPAPVAVPTNSPTILTLAPSVPATLTPTTVAPVSIVPTTAPSLACSSLPRKEAFLSVLSEITDVDLLQDESTPQGYAFSWLVDSDPANVDPCSYPTVIQRYALVTFYQSTNGDSWSENTGWLSEQPECLWFGVSCDSDSVRDLQLRRNNLSGTIPSELKALVNISRIDLYTNEISGTIPVILSLLPSLRYFDVEDNNMAGSAFVDLPPGIESFRVSLNDFTGTFPILPELPSLTDLWCADNQLTGSFAPGAITNLSSLKSLIVYGNNFNGPLPTGLSTLEKFLAQDNSFTSTIPPDLFQNKPLQELRLDKNRLTGTIPSDIGNLMNLKDLRLGENELTGRLPPEVARLSNLEILHVNATRMSGTISNSFETFTSLKFVDLSSNEFTGPIPSSIFTSSVELLYFSENAFSGTIPSNFGSAAMLRDFYVDDNRLSGTVPSIQENQLQDFTEFRLERNAITGTMPASICALRGDDPNTDLVTLIADCGGDAPLIQCDCCNGCIDNS